MNVQENKSPSYIRARATLPKELRGVFDRFVADYQFCATLHVGRRIVAYHVAAEMIRQGWRDTKNPVKGQ